MDIDGELMQLLEDCIYQEGLFKNFKDKKNAKIREKIMYGRRKLREDIKNLPERTLEVINWGEEIAEEDHSPEGMDEEMSSIATFCSAVVKCANLLEPEEVQAAKKAIALFPRVQQQLYQILKAGMRNGQIDEFRGKEWKSTLAEMSVANYCSTYSGDVSKEIDRIRNVMNNYNQIMAEKQHPTDN